MAEKLSGQTNEVAVVYDDLLSSVYSLPASKISMVFDSSSTKLKAGAAYVPPRPADTEKEDTGEEIEPYDVDNQHPQRLKKIIESNTKLQVGLKNSANELLGHGIHTGIFEFDEKTGEDVFKFQRNLKWAEWAKRANIFENFEGLATRNLVSHYMAFVSLIFNEDGSEIVSIKARSPLECRFSKANAKGVYEFVYCSRQWHNNPSLTDRVRVVKLPVIDTWYIDFDVLRNQIMQSKTREYVLVLRIPTDDFPYSYPDYLAVIRQKYVEQSNNVPRWKDAIMKHQTTTNQILYVSEDYFRIKYAMWDVNIEKAKAGDKVAISYIRERREAVVKNIHEEITGIDKSGKMLMGHLLSNPNNFSDKEQKKSFVIEAVEQVNFGDKWIPDANEADRQILFAIDLDAAAYGGLPGATDTGGSNKREASNNSQLRKFTMEEVLLKPYRFIRDYNKMGDFDFRVKRSMTPTLDVVSAKDRQLNQPK